MTNGTQGATPTGSGSGLDPKLAGALCYVCTWLTGLIFILVEKENKEVRFHAFQALFLGLGVIAYYILSMIMMFIPIVNVIFVLLNVLVALGMFVLIVVCAIKAYQGTRLEIPVIADLAKKQIGEIQ